jgi:predicted nucleic acid-binding Zn ribbon protein
MPIHEYKCPACGKVVEQVELNPNTAVLPVCVHYTTGTDGETHYPMRRITSASVARFNGAGFHVNDYKRK